MATTRAIPDSHSILHTRGSWPARDDRTPSLVWLGIWWVGLTAGFGVDIPRYFHENPAAPWIVHVHGAIFTVWTLLITAQVLLVVRDRVDLHRKLGWVLAAWACVMAVMGPVAILASQAVNSHGSPTFDPAFLSIAFNNILCFVILVAWGLTLRKNPAAHRRIMILTAVAIADPGFARFSGWLWPQQPTSILLYFVWVFYGNMFLIALMTAWDWYRGRLMRQFVFGAAGLLAAEATATLLYFWPPWKTVAISWIAAWANHFG
jgi:uncharacterized membrane protein